MDTFPPNSKKAVDPAPAPKRVEQVTSAEAVRRRRRLGRQFSHTFFGGDAHTALEYMIGNVILPSVKEMMVEAASSGFERLIYGEARPRRGAPQANRRGPRSPLRPALEVRVGIGRRSVRPRRDRQPTHRLQVGMDESPRRGRRPCSRWRISPRASGASAPGLMNDDELRSYVAGLYKGPKWTARVNRMSIQQVYAIYKAKQQHDERHPPKPPKKDPTDDPPF
jgi:hypothetical protein